MKILILTYPNFENTLEAMRLPMNGESDLTYYKWSGKVAEGDLKLLTKLVKAGTDHSKAIRGTWVTFKIQAPRYWWSEMDTYTVGKQTLSSTSTMHTITKRDLIKSDFEQEIIFPDVLKLLNKIRNDSNLNATEKLLEIKQHLPESFLQTRIVQINYQSLRNMYKQRHKHRLREWREFCKVLETLPYATEFLI